MQAISDKRQDSARCNALPITIDASKQGVEWLFGLLEGMSVTALGMYPVAKGGPPSSQAIHEARALADQYDIDFFDIILAQAMFQLAGMSSRCAATALGVAYHMRNLALCQFAAARLAPHPNTPQGMGREFTNAIGHGMIAALAIAYVNCVSFCHCKHPTTQGGCDQPTWKGSAEQWAELSSLLELPSS